MQPKLKENPREWLRFTAVMVLLGGIVAALLFRRQVLSWNALLAVDAALLLAMAVCIVRPRWFRGFYRAGMTAAFHVGQFMGRVLLTLVFLFLLTPLGLFLRIAGKDLLRLKRRPGTPTYWQPARRSQHLDRQF